MEVHPEEDDDRQDGEHTDNDARDAFGLVGGREGCLDKGEFGIGVFGVGRFGAHAGFLSEMRSLRREVTP